MSRDCIYVVAGAIMMGTLPIFVRNIKMGAIQITFFRLSIGFLFLAIFLLLMNVKPEIRNWKLVILISVVNTITIVSYIKAIQLTKVATAALLLYMAPVYVVPLSAIFGEKVQLKHFLSLITSIVGLWLIVSPKKLEGDIFGVISGIFYAIYFLIMKRARAEMDSLSITFAYLGISSLILLSILIPSLMADIFTISINCTFWIVGLGLIPTALAFTVFNHGIKGCGAGKSSISALVEPLSAGIFGYLFFGEVLTIKQTVGGMLILLAVFSVLND